MRRSESPISAAHSTRFHEARSAYSLPFKLSAMDFVIRVSSPVIESLSQSPAMVRVSGIVLFAVTPQLRQKAK